MSQPSIDLKIDKPLIYQQCNNCAAKYVVLRLHKTAADMEWTDRFPGLMCPYCGHTHTPKSNLM